jgi:hypothetical protein
MVDQQKQMSGGEPWNKALSELMKSDFIKNLNLQQLISDQIKHLLSPDSIKQILSKQVDVKQFLTPEVINAALTPETIDKILTPEVIDKILTPNVVKALCEKMKSCEQK